MSGWIAATGSCGRCRSPGTVRRPHPPVSGDHMAAFSAVRPRGASRAGPDAGGSIPPFRDLVLRIHLVILGVLAALAGGALQTAAQTAVLPLDEVRPGMVGEGRTVFAGEEVESFGVEIVGVLDGAMPGRSIVLANLSGGPLAHTGVMQGMSGSPVYVDGRLLGAVAYAFPFAKDPICGITPFEEMVRFTEMPLGAVATPGGGTPALRFSPAGEPSFDPAPAPEIGIERDGRQLLPIRTPVAASGLSPAAHRIVAPLFRQLGMELSPSGFTGAAAQAGVSPLKPGSPVGATLIGGDLVLMASGTVTHVDEATGEVFAFGHPFTGLGTISIPMQAARVEANVASLSNSFRITSAGSPIGVWQQDRATGVRGRLGARARTIPLRIQVEGSRGGRRDYDLEIVDHDLYSPVLAFSALVAVLSQEERPAGTQTIRLGARIGVGDGRTLAVEDVFASASASVLTGAAALVAAPVALLLGNPVERIPVREIDVDISASEEAQAATLTRAWLRSSRVRPGGTATLRVAFRDFRGAEATRELEVPIPRSAAGSRLTLLVADALSVALSDQRQGVTGTPARVEQIYRAISRHRRQSRLYVRLVGSGRSAAVVGGEYLPSLPPSVRSVVSRDSSGGLTRELPASVLWEGHLDFDATVSGSRQLTLQVEAR
ncbi:MAG: hypothetical protein F4228_12735 [Acidobacteria bacterium]|nr:hypothetical protein [Acidobacteriota bacterium]MYF15556.1 hypothetical protein [Acidobacteriota bacterium]MYI95808.1 hypothetical protein [Acidobacteriota bacterium]